MRVLWRSLVGPGRQDIRELSGDVCGTPCAGWVMTWDISFIFKNTSVPPCYMLLTKQIHHMFYSAVNAPTKKTHFGTSEFDWECSNYQRVHWLLAFIKYLSVNLNPVLIKPYHLIKAKFAHVTQKFDYFFLSLNKKAKDKIFYHHFWILSISSSRLHCCERSNLNKMWFVFQ